MLAILGTSNEKSSFASVALDGLLGRRLDTVVLIFAGLVLGDTRIGVVLLCSGLGGEVIPVSLRVGWCPGLVFGAVLLGDPEIVLDATGFDLTSGGLARGS
jgi:hypothetical protein